MRLDVLPHRAPRPVELLAILATSMGLSGCESELADAYGNFESTPVTVSAETSGRLLSLTVDEGDDVEVDQVVAQLDTMQQALQVAELVLQIEATSIRVSEAGAQTRSLEAQLAAARDDQERTRRLFEQDAATAGAVNRLEGTVASLTEQIAAARSRVRLARQEGAITEARLAQLRDRIDRATVINPTRGTVLTTFAEEGEILQAGRPLYSVAPLDTLTLRAYVSGGQLTSLRVGGRVDVRFDSGAGELATRSGRVTWVSPRAEFTPTPIQTREERVDQVYAVKIVVPNEDRALKIGMPAEVVLPTGAPEGTP